jgi:hypothetical protein
MISSILRDSILDFVENRITTHDLEEWFVPRLPELIKYPDSADADVISAIELGLTELDLGIRTRENFVNFLKQVLREHSVVITYLRTSPITVNQTGSSNGTPRQAHIGAYSGDMIRALSVVVQ